MQLLIRFFSFEERSFKSGSGKQIAMYRRIYSKRKHGAFCIEILQCFLGNRSCSIFAFTDQHVFLEGVSCHNVNFLIFVPPTSDRRSKERQLPIEVPANEIFLTTYFKSVRAETRLYLKAWSEESTSAYRTAVTAAFMAEITSLYPSGDFMPNTAEPATKVSAPALATSAMLFVLMPPSTSRRMLRPVRAS